MNVRMMIATVVLIGFCFGAKAWTQERSAQQQAWTYILQARQGDGTAAQKAVTLLEQAVAAAPDDRALLDLLGRSYFMKLSTQSRTVADPNELLSTVGCAKEVFERVLKMNPNDSDALSGHGMALTLFGAFQRSPNLITTGIEEMNRAIELAPTTTHLRLTRGFTMVNMPFPIRNNTTVIEDLSVLLKVAAGTNQRAVDSLHIMLGDIYFESGQLDQAKHHYDAVAGDSSSAKEQAQGRLTAMQDGSIPAAEIARFRSGVGSNCTMCHAQ